MKYLNRVILMLLAASLASCQSANKKQSEPIPNNSTPPMLTKPEVKKIWVPPAIEDDGKVYREGYFKWVLEKGSLWNQ